MTVDQEPPPIPAAPVVITRRAQLRRVAVRHYAGLRFHARNCTDCRPGDALNDPPRISRGCRVGMAGKLEYERAYQEYRNCPEEDQ